MKTFTLHNIAIQLTREGWRLQHVRAITDIENILLPNQQIANVERIITENVATATAFYEARIDANNNTLGFIREQHHEHTDYIETHDLHRICIKIVFEHLYKRNLWKESHHKMKVDMKLKPADLDDTATHDTIISYYKTKHPEDWRLKCSILLGMQLPEFDRYYEGRELFYNK